MVTRGVDPEWDAHILSGEDIGSDHWIRRDYKLPDGRIVGYPAGQQPPEGSVFIGLTDNHLQPGTEEWCGGWIGFKNVEGSHEESKHTLESVEPLHVEPSLACRRCASHGFIRDGRWSEC